jgi:hypothetical protein
VGQWGRAFKSGHLSLDIGHWGEHQTTANFVNIFFRMFRVFRKQLNDDEIREKITAQRHFMTAGCNSWNPWLIVILYRVFIKYHKVPHKK